MIIDDFIYQLLSKKHFFQKLDELSSDSDKPMPEKAI